MVSITTEATRLLASPHLTTHFFFPRFIDQANRAKRVKFATSSTESRFFLDLRRNGNRFCWSPRDGFSRKCKEIESWDGDFVLEAEILEFMKNSEDPDVFPSKKQLMVAGRFDLVEAIVTQGGWLAMGWDSSNDQEEEEDKFSVGEANDVAWSSGVSNLSVDSLPSSTSTKSIEAMVEDDCGIEGILYRLEKERNIELGADRRDDKKRDPYLRTTSQNDSLPSTSMDETVNDFQRNSRSVGLSTSRSLINDSDIELEKNSLLGIDRLKNSLEPQSWRSWSMQRATFSDSDFESAEISSLESSGISGLELDSSKFREGGSNSSLAEVDPDHIRNRLQYLQSELSSALHLLRSNNSKAMSGKGDSSAGDNSNSGDELQNVSDDWEFEQDRITNAQNKLRSLRAKLAVVEGKLALTIIDAQRIVEDKQKKIDHARRALRLLRTASVVWPNSASEVLLAGSFDGWATQRKMEKSRTGIFSLELKLYPGKYEIKFIVDGKWKIDPLRPIVRYSGYENNLLVIT